MKKLKNKLQGAVAAVALTLAFGVSAQNAQPPAGLKWQMMHTIYFNTGPAYPSIDTTTQEKLLLQKIWTKELMNAAKKGGGSPESSSIIAVTYRLKDKTVVFSSY